MQINKEKFLEWLDVEIDLSSGRSEVERADKWAYGQVKKEILSGTFDIKKDNQSIPLCIHGKRMDEQCFECRKTIQTQPREYRQG